MSTAQFFQSALPIPVRYAVSRDIRGVSGFVDPGGPFAGGRTSLAMPEPTSVLSPWSNFYVITGSSAAALTGLMFVVITLVVGRRRSEASEGISTFSTPTVLYFCAGLFISAMLSAPWRSLVHVATVIVIAGVAGVAYIVRVMVRTRRQTAYDPEVEDWIWYSMLPMMASLTVVAGGILLTRIPVEAMFVLGAATLMFIFIGIRNAWDIVTYIALDLAPKERPDDGPA